MDREFREKLRRGEVSLADRLRAGQLSEERARLAATLGHAEAAELVEPLELPAPTGIEGLGDPDSRVLRVLLRGGLSEVQVVELTTILAERTLTRATDEQRPQCERVFRQLWAWLEDPSLANEGPVRANIRFFLRFGLGGQDDVPPALAGPSFASAAAHAAISMNMKGILPSEAAQLKAHLDQFVARTLEATYEAREPESELDWQRERIATWLLEPPPG